METTTTRFLDALRRMLYCGSSARAPAAVRSMGDGVRAESDAIDRAIAKILSANPPPKNAALQCQRLCTNTNGAVRLNPRLVPYMVQRRDDRDAWLATALCFLRHVSHRQIDDIRVFCLSTRREESLLSYLVIELLYADQGAGGIALVHHLLSLKYFCDPTASAGTASESPLARVLLHLAANPESSSDSSGQIPPIRAVAEKMLQSFTVEQFLERARKKHTKPVPSSFLEFRRMSGRDQCAEKQTCAEKQRVRDPFYERPVVSAEEELWWIYVYACSRLPWLERGHVPLSLSNYTTMR